MPQFRRSEPPDVTLHEVQNQDLDLIRSAGNRATQGASGASATASSTVAILLTLATCDVPVPWRTILGMTAFACVVGAFVFGRMWWRGHREGQRRVDTIKERPIAERPGPAVDERLERLLEQLTREEESP